MVTVHLNRIYFWDDKKKYGFMKCVKHEGDEPKRVFIHARALKPYPRGGVSLGSVIVDAQIDWDGPRGPRLLVGKWKFTGTMGLLGGEMVSERGWTNEPNYDPADF